MQRNTVNFFFMTSILFSLGCLILSIIMTQECISVRFYTESCCEILGELSIQKSLFSAQGTSLAKIYDTNQTVTLRYPSSRYWRLYITSQKEIEEWYNLRNNTFFCNINDGMAITGKCDYILPLLGIILNIINIILSASCLYQNISKTEFRPIQKHKSVRSVKKRPIPRMLNSGSSFDSLYSTIESPTSDIMTTTV